MKLIIKKYACSQRSSLQQPKTKAYIYIISTKLCLEKKRYIIIFDLLFQIERMTTFKAFSFIRYLSLISK